MDVRYPPEAEDFRAKVKAFLSEHLPKNWSGIGSLDHQAAEKFVEEWRSTLLAHGLLAVSWPREYGGGGLGPLEHLVLAEELTKAHVPMGGSHDHFGIKMLGNTLLRWGTEDQKQYFLPRILSGVDRWCQGYSEPNAGSDLGNLGCRAILDAERWIINGQKIWTSLAARANWIFVLARTDPVAPKHRGISFLLCPMNQPGIEVRPIRMMNGADEFCEVFFADARTAAANVVGQVNGGWAVAMTLLQFERGESAATFPIMFREEFDRLLALARTYGRLNDPLIRDRFVRCYSRLEVMRFSGYRTLSRFLKGEGPDAESSSISKLSYTEYHKQAAELAMDVMGLHGIVPTGRPPARSVRADDPGSPNSTASWAGTFLNARGGTIYAGSSEIQRNILGERALGLPKEQPNAAPDRDDPGPSLPQPRIEG